MVRFPDDKPLHLLIKIISSEPLLIIPLASNINTDGSYLRVKEGGDIRKSSSHEDEDDHHHTRQQRIRQEMTEEGETEKERGRDKIIRELITTELKIKQFKLIITAVVILGIFVAVKVT